MAPPPKTATEGVIPVDMTLRKMRFRTPGCLDRSGSKRTVRCSGDEAFFRRDCLSNQSCTDSILHKAVRFRAETEDGEAIEMHGDVLSVCPTKIPMPGGATFVNEGLAEFHWGERTGYGIAEHWHAVTL